MRFKVWLAYPSEARWFPAEEPVDDWAYVAEPELELNGTIYATSATASTSCANESFELMVDLAIDHYLKYTAPVVERARVRNLARVAECKQAMRDRGLRRYPLRLDQGAWA